MLVFYHADDVRKFRKKLSAENKTLGFVPTMGALHEAHLKLAQRALQENHACLVSIFVNPTQFNNAEDLDQYPRLLEEDLKKLESIDVTAVFAPAVSEIYGAQVASEKIELGGLDAVMEGLHRPGHFAGVATVVKRFFEIVQPQRAYFGRKDFQQLRIIQHVNQRLKLGVEIIGSSTERSAEGLALSSRNLRLSEAGKQKALIIYQSLIWAKQNFSKYQPQTLKAALQERFKASELELEYVEIADSKSLQPLQNWHEARHARLFIVAWCEGVRLIDNYGLF